jgi:hypothetical protein
MTYEYDPLNRLREADYGGIRVHKEGTMTRIHKSRFSASQTTITVEND